MNPLKPSGLATARARILEPRRLIAIRVDPSVLESFRKEARRRHVGYQALIHEVLAEQCSFVLQRHRRIDTHRVASRNHTPKDRRHDQNRRRDGVGERVRW